MNQYVSQVDTSSGNFTLKSQKSGKICTEIPKER